MALQKEFKEVINDFRYNRERRKEEIKRDLQEVAAKVRQKEFERKYMDMKKRGR
jgi:hypothetical protein